MPNSWDKHSSKFNDFCNHSPTRRNGFQCGPILWKVHLPAYVNDLMCYFTSIDFMAWIVRLSWLQVLFKFGVAANLFSSFKCKISSKINLPEKRNKNNYKYLGWIYLGEAEGAGKLSVLNRHPWQMAVSFWLLSKIRTRILLSIIKCWPLKSY